MKKILVIEDELVLREGISEILNFEGYEVFQAENGEKGLSAAFQHQPDLILCDIMMPVMDGYDVLRKLHSNDCTRLIPFVFMTALADRSDMRMGMELGSDDYITKPYTRVELLKAVTSRLKKSEEIKEKSESSLDELRENIISHLPHELRTPLNGMLGFGQQLMDYPESITHEDLAEIGKNIYDSAVRLYRLIQNYLIYTQMELKKGKAEKVSPLMDADLLCERVARETAQNYGRMDDLSFQLKYGMVCISETELIKMVEELTDNAFKFSRPGTKVIVGCEPVKEKFRIWVGDEGRGIAAADIDKIGAYMQFERKNYEQQGSGLGLIISKRIAELFEGEMSIQSTQGKGTTVMVTFPGELSRTPF